MEMKLSTLPTTYQEFIALSRYSRFRPDLGRRETWEETVDRLIEFWDKQLPSMPKEETARVRGSILSLDVMPSMRSLMTAGPALERDHVAQYNCSFSAVQGTGPKVSLWDDKLRELGHEEPITIAIRNPIAFDEMFYILLCGTGAGFSVERQFVNEMPTVGKKLSRSIYARNNKNFPGVDKQELSFFDKKANTITVADSKYGWASALRIFVVEMYNGNFQVQTDVSAVRKAGATLKTFGGRASGPGPLLEMFEGIRTIFTKAAGRKLSSLEAHDVMCLIANAVVVGGVRRAAMISFSNLSDERMRHAKSGDWWVENSQRALANNSVAYTEKPDIGVFMREWQALYESRSGERGLFNVEGAMRAAAEIGRDITHTLRGNPCLEILLRIRQFCNLTSTVIRPEDTLEDLMNKVEIATILGTMQATLTDFVYLSPEWKKNCDEERLLGVSMCGGRDHPVLGTANPVAKEWLKTLREHARAVNKKWAAFLGINPAAAITCVKPEGTVSQLVDAASGLHSRYAPYYFRRIRADEKDPLAQVMKQQGYPCEYDLMQKSTLVFTFPVKAPEQAVFAGKDSAIQQLEYWMMWKKCWTDHNPSVTITVQEHEWLEVGAWVYKNFDDICGLSFLPASNHVYKQAPYEACTKEQYEALAARMPTSIDYEMLKRLETTDQTTAVQQYSCSAGVCDLV